ncbi:putative hydroxymethylpyrimidine transport system substrate-binding protein [Moryella indoligenes]|uniref:Hydroxymethylpyrimidine transport system substrate-binding protein n=1 Tax=Moryella indoligenes TaxID=371674 RepID=A0AAE4AJJ4_9FIRM|nr:ABC transporter substrate-binding protein [Moryella indoligenes]MDQ0151883.1 putative hydroxymethylpyrimidine transport system substrate-binding protein [Moryella indoligenes]
MKSRRSATVGVLLAGAVLMSLGFTACGSQSADHAGSAAGEMAAGTSGEAKSSGQSETSKAGAAQGELRELNLVLDWYPNAIHSFIYTAIERGYYRDEGLDVKVRFPANDNDGLALVAAGKAELSAYYQQDVIQAVANQGIGLRSIGAICQTPLNIILSLKEKNIQSPKDFVGRTVGYGGTALSEAMVQALMKDVGEDPSAVTLQNVGFELMSSMTTGAVDATIGCLVNHEVPQLEEEGFELNYFPLTDYGVPNFYELCFLTNEKLLQREPEVLRAFLRASKRGFEDFQADPEASLQILLDNQNEENFPLSPDVERKSAEILLPLMEQEDAPFLSQTEACWQQNIDWMYEQGLIERKPEPGELMVNLDYERR